MAQLTPRNALTFIGYFLSGTGAVVLLVWFFLGAEPAWQCGIADAAFKGQVQTVWACLHKADLDPVVGVLSLLSGFFLYWARKFTSERQSERGSTKDEQFLLQVESDRRKLVQQLRNRVKQQLELFCGSSSPIELNKEVRPSEVNNSFAQTFWLNDTKPYTLKEGTHIIDVFDDADGWLLVLGEPGTGKTITLFQLTGQLLERHETANKEPIPIVLSLASWNSKHNSLASWLTDEMRDKYKMPTEVISYLMQNRQLILVLDALDEVSTLSRTACLQALNAFRLQYPMGMVVSCRSNEYEDLGVKLDASNAVLLKPLSRAQIDQTLCQHQTAGEALRSVLESYPELRQLATIPLFLFMMSNAMPELSDMAFEDGISEKQLRQRVLCSYVREQVKPFLTARPGYAPSSTVKYLITLAQHLEWSNTSIFLPELAHQGIWFSVRVEKVRLFLGLSIAVFSTLAYVAFFAFTFIPNLSGNGSGLSSWWQTFATFDTPTRILLVFSVAWIAFLFYALIIKHPKRQGSLETPELRKVNWRRWDSDIAKFCYSALTAFGIVVLIRWFWAFVNGTAYIPSFDPGKPSEFAQNVALVAALVSLYLTMTFEFFLPLLLLTLNGGFPWNITPFLEYCVARKLLLRIGPSYSFIHRVLQEYFVGLDLQYLRLDDLDMQYLAAKHSRRK